MDKMKCTGKAAYIGIENRMVKFIECIQLKKDDLWTLFTDQFAGFADTHDYGWRGEYWGKLMRGACMTYQYTKDSILYETMEKSVYTMLKNADENGRFSTYAVVKEFDGWDMWSRKYVLLGFLYFYEICLNDELKASVLSAMKGHMNYIIEHIGDGKINICDTSPVWQGVNSASILEPVMLLYNITNDSRYLDFAEHIVKSGGAKEFDIFRAAYEDKLTPNEYPVKKAYELMSCFEGLIEYYKATGEEKWKIAAENFAKRLIQSEITIIGCAGCEHECFNDSVLMQTYSKYDGLMQETCVTVTWMKLCFKLLCLTGKSIYADEIEKSAYNALYGAVNTNSSTNNDDTVFDMSWFKEVYKVYTSANAPQPFDSYSPLRLGTRGRAVGGFRPMRDNSTYSGCCIVIGAAGLALVPLMAVMQSDSGLVFNLYLRGSYESDEFKVFIKTAYPAESSVEILVDSDARKEIRLRIPHYSKNTKIKINGIEAEYEVDNGYAVIERSWNKGDVISIDLDMNLRICRGMENPEDENSIKHIAFLYGPLVLARDARVSEVGTSIEVDENNISYKAVNTAGFDTMCEFEINTGKETIRMIDYASAGKTWDKESMMEAWLKTE